MGERRAWNSVSGGKFHGGCTTDKGGYLRYLSSGAIKGIGPKMADTIFRKFGLQTLEIMENNPQELLKIRGISEKKLAAIVESYGKTRCSGN